MMILGSPMNREKLANHKRALQGNLDDVQETSLNKRVSNILYSTKLWIGVRNVFFCFNLSFIITTL